MLAVRTRRESGLVLTLASVALAFALAVGVGTTRGSLIDHRLMVTVQASPAAVAQITRFLDWVSVSALAGLAAALGLVACALRRYRAAIAAPLTLLGASIVTQVIKSLAGSSMPSGHTTAGVALALGLVMVAPARLRLAAVAAATAIGTLVGESTLVAYWHVPGDVIAAALVCMTVATLSGLLAVSLVPGPRPTGTACATGTAGGAGRGGEDARGVIRTGRTLAVVAAVDALIVLLMAVLGVRPAGGRIDMVAMWVAHGVPAMFIAAAVLWTARLTHTVLDRPAVERTRRPAQD